MGSLPPEEIKRTDVRLFAAAIAQMAAEEIRRVWAALEGEGVAGEAIRFCFYTAARASEILQLPWREVDLSERLWTLPGERSKNRAPHPIPLSSGAMSVLERLRAVSAGEWVFPSPQIEGLPLATARHTLERIFKRTGIPDFGGFHDIRRTVSNTMETVLETPGDVVEDVLGHARPRLKRTYVPGRSIPQMRRAMERWSAELDRIRGANSSSATDDLLANERERPIHQSVG